MQITVAILSNRCCSGSGRRKHQKLLYAGTDADTFLRESNAFLVDENHRYHYEFLVTLECAKNRVELTAGVAPEDARLSSASTVSTGSTGSSPSAAKSRRRMRSYCWNELVCFFQQFVSAPLAARTRFESSSASSLRFGNFEYTSVIWLDDEEKSVFTCVLYRIRNGEPCYDPAKACGNVCESFGMGGSGGGGRCGSNGSGGIPIPKPRAPFDAKCSQSLPANFGVAVGGGGQTAPGHSASIPGPSHTDVDRRDAVSHGQNVPVLGQNVSVLVSGQSNANLTHRDVASHGQNVPVLGQSNANLTHRDMASHGQNVPVLGQSNANLAHRDVTNHGQNVPVPRQSNTTFDLDDAQTYSNLSSLRAAVNGDMPARSSPSSRPYVDLQSSLPKARPQTDAQPLPQADGDDDRDLAAPDVIPSNDRAFAKCRAKLGKLRRIKELMDDEEEIDDE